MADVLFDINDVDSMYAYRASDRKRTKTDILLCLLALGGFLLALACFTATVAVVIINDLSITAASFSVLGVAVLCVL
ncbi:hypothetical protein IWQ61_009558, partial [Dispira simplex]